MASPSERKRNNVRAGIFVMVTLAFGLAAVIVLSDVVEQILTPKTEYTVSFEVADGVKNLKKGSSVRVGGLLKGKVTKVREIVDGDKDPPLPFREIQVDFEVEKDITLYDGTKISVSSALIGENAWLDITSVGDPKKPVSEEHVFKGTSASGIIGSLLGTEGVDDFDAIMENVKKTTTNLRDLTANIKSDWTGYDKNVDDFLVWAMEATVDLDEILEEGKGLMADSHDVVKHNRPAIDLTFENLEATTANTREITRHFREQTMDKMDQLLETGGEALDTTTRLVQSVDQEFDLWAPNIREALSSAMQMTQQLKLAAQELRRSPWKVFYRPRNEELDNELLYAAAGSFAAAASDLRTTVESAQRLLDNHGEQVMDDPETKELLNKLVQTSLERYRQAEENLAAVLFEDVKAP